MARTSPAVTPQEEQLFLQFCDQHHIRNEHANGVLLGRLIMDTWQMDITPGTLDAAFKQVKDKLMTYYSPAEVRLNALHLSQGDIDYLVSFVERSPNLKSDGDNLLTNVATIASYMRQQRLPIQHADNNILTRLAQQSTQSYPLAWKMRLQDSEKKTETEMSSHELEIIKNRAESVVVRTPSGLVNNSKTTLVREIVAKDPSGKIDWRKTLVLRERAAQN
jgi:hypothetical protein